MSRPGRGSLRRPFAEARGPAAQQRHGSRPRTVQAMIGSTTTRAAASSTTPPPRGRAPPGTRRTATGSALACRSAGPCRCRRCRPGSDARGPSRSPRERQAGRIGRAPARASSRRSGAAGAARAGAAPADSGPTQRSAIAGRAPIRQPLGGVSPSGPGARCVGPTRSRISSRLWPVMVRPWFLRPMTARDGSGACRTSSATSSASSSVPQG